LQDDTHPVERGSAQYGLPQSVANCWGRDPGLPPLTAEDGRTALRLMHEVVEANDIKKNPDIKESVKS
jgi:hypothetical protein